MNKVICDVCGTAYPETTAQCPICGSAKNSADQTVAAAAPSEETSGYTYVKGGRFSKRNVRMRNQKPKNSDNSRPNREPEDKANTGLIIVVVLLLLAIVSVIIYIGIKFFPAALPDNNPSETGSSQYSEPSQSDSTDGSSEPSQTVSGIPCESIKLSNSVIMLQNAGDTWPLSAMTSPLDTTDEIVFTSSDETVVTVSEAGVITAVGGGEATITVTCGTATDECLVSCTFSSTDVTEPGVAFEFQFNTRFVDEQTGYSDATIESQTWKVYKGTPSVAVTEINWVSDDPSICTVKDGIMTLFKSGTTKIHAEYGGVTYTCIIRSKYNPPATEEETNSDTTDASTPANEQTPEKPKYKTNKEGQGNDVTIAVGESFNLYLLDEEGNAVTVTWTAEDTTTVSIEGNKITGRTANLKGVKVSTTHEGETYSCVVRVSG